MPGFDGTGPQGAGPMTGGAVDTVTLAGEILFAYGRGYGTGRGFRGGFAGSPGWEDVVMGEALVEEEPFLLLVDGMVQLILMEILTP